MGRLFLPFATQGRQIELRAIAIKRKFGFGPYEALSPDALADRMGAAIVAPEWLEQLPGELRRSLLHDHAQAWSAGSLSVNGTLAIVTNPTHAETRRNVSLLEELAHEALGHQKSQLTVEGGVAMRTCDHRVEDEAYAVAAALLMPYRDLFNHLNAGRPIEELNVPVPVSVDCRLFRVKRAGLWRLHKVRQRPE